MATNAERRNDNSPAKLLGNVQMTVSAKINRQNYYKMLDVKYCST